MTNYSRIIEILGRLIEYPTITGNAEAVHECMMYAERTFTLANMHINRYSCNGYESLVATTRDTMQPRLLLQSHVDVVPGNPELFSLKRKDGRLLGRGVFDMKYALACFLKIVEDLHEELQDYDFGIMLTSDEELNGENGVKYLLDQGYSCKVCILPDGGDNWRVESAAKGNWMVSVCADGKAAHGSRPWEGENSAEKLVDFLHAARDISPIVSHTDTTVALSTIHSGIAHNQIPQNATATFDIRYLNQDALLVVKQKMQQLAAAYNMRLETIHTIPAIQLDVTLPVVKDWERIVQEIRGPASEGYSLSFGSSDARYFSEKSIPAIVTRPNGGGHHSENEWIDESELYEFYQCLKMYVISQAYKPLEKTP